MTRIRDPQLVNNKLGPNNSHEPFALLENKGKPDEIYRRVDCCLLVDKNGACENCKKLRKTMIKIRNRFLAGTKSVKINHASQEILGPNILHYIRISLLNNLHLHEKFSFLLKFATHDNVNSENSENSEGKLLLSKEDHIFLFERIVSTYMKSRQKTWRQYNGYIPEKGTASLRENLKVMRSNNQVPSKNEKGKISNQIKKSNLPTNLMLALIQLRVWVHLEDAENLFAKIFLVTDLLWLLWAFGVKTPLKRKNALVPLLVNHLKNETPFSDEALARKSMFAPE